MGSVRASRGHRRVLNVRFWFYPIDARTTGLGAIQTSPGLIKGPTVASLNFDRETAKADIRRIALHEIDALDAGRVAIA